MTRGELSPGDGTPAPAERGAGGSIGPGRRFGAVSAAFGVGVTLLLGVVFARVAKLQVSPGEALAAHTSARESSVRLAPMRGVLRDRRGRSLAAPETRYRVVVDPVRVDEAALGSMIVGLSREIGLDPERVGERVLRALDRNDARLAAHERGESEQTGASASPSGWRETLEFMLTPPEPAPEGPRLVRYVRIGEPIGHEAAARVRELGLAGVSLEPVESRVYPAGDLVASIVGRAGEQPLEKAADGWLGAEKRWDDRLAGESGRGTYVRDHLGRPLWVERGAWRAPMTAPDLHLSLDLEIQRIAMDELRRGVEEADAAAGRVVVMAPETGEVLAMGDVYRDVPDAIDVPWLVKPAGSEAWLERAVDGERPRRPRYRVIPPDPRRERFAALGRNRCVEDVYEPGSTFKPLVWSEAMRLGLLRSDEIVDTHNNAYKVAGRTLSDVTPRDSLTWDEVLVYSSNIGMAQISERLTFKQLRDTVIRYGFDRPSGVGLAGDSAGIVTSARDWNMYSQASVAMGHEVAVTPVQMARAFCVFARNDERAGTLPAVRLTASDELAGAAYDPMPVLVERVLPAPIALRARSAMLGVVDRLDTLNKRRFGDDASDPAGWRTYAMFGKSGTAQIPCVPPAPDADGTRYRRPRGMGGYYDGQYNSSFIAGAPAAQPRVVVLVVIDDPGPGLVRVRQQWGSWTAGPVVRRIVERTLRYLDVPADEEVAQEQDSIAHAD